MVTKVRYSMDVIRDEVRYLVEKGVISPHQPIYRLCEYFPVKQWVEIARELKSNNFLLKDFIIALLPQEESVDDRS